MKKMLAWLMALLLTLTGPLATGTAKASGTTSATASNTSTQTVTQSVYQNDDEEDEDEEVDQDDQDKDKDKDKKKDHEKKFEDKYKGIEKALESLLKARNDGNGEASNAALDAVIAKLKEMLKQDGTVSTDDEAEDALEETVADSVYNGTATEQEVEILVTIQVKGKKVDEAQSNVETALTHNPNSDKLYDLLKQVFQEKGDTSKVKVYVNGKKPAFDVEPFVKDDRTLVPVRAISEALGADVTWNQETQTAVIVKGNVTIELPLGSKQIKVNGQTVTIDSAAEVKNDRILVPVRFISEFLGEQVDWDSQTNMVIVK